MEKLWAVMLQKINGLDNTVSRVVVEHQQDLLRLWNHHKHGEALHATWKDSKVLSELEKLLSQLDQTASNDLKRKRDRDDQDNIADTYGDDLGVAVQLEPQYRVSDLLKPEQTTPNNTSLNHLPSANVGRQLPGMAPGLIDHYFVYTHCWFPVLSKPLTLKTFYECRRQNTGPLPDTSALACLWALCAYTRQQALHSQLPLSDRERISSQVETWRTIAWELIPRDREGSHPGHVQALLLLVLLDLGLGRWSSAWVMVGQAVRMLLDRVSALQNPPKEWLATLQGSFILDTMVADRLGRPPHLQSEHIRCTKRLDQDSHEEWEPWNAGAEFQEPAFTVSCFNRATELCLILNTKSSGRPSQEGSYDLALQVQRVAESMSFPVVELERRPPHQMLLQLHYFATLVKVSDLNGEGQLGACWKFVEVLELCNDLWNEGETAAIPSLAVLLSHHVESILSALRDVPGILPVSVLRQRLQQAKSRMSGGWPSFKVNAHPDTLAPQSTSWDTGRLRSSTAGTLFPILDAATNTTPSLLSTQSSFWPVRREPIAVQRRTTSPGNEMAIPPILHDPKISHMMQTFNPQPQPQPALSTQSLDYGPMAIDIPDPQERLNPFLPIGSEDQPIGGATSSPSFNGDEIDALFHEMAELDTTQWSLNRSQGLRDFGFQDDSTFEAFCNDPDRLMLSDNYMGPAFSNNVTHVGNQGAYSPSLQPQVGGSGMKQGAATFDIFDGAWKG